MKIILVGGLNADSYAKGEAWSAYKAGVVAEVDIQNPEQSRVILSDYTTPPYLPSDTNVSTVFKAAELNGNILTVCSTTEIFQLDLQAGRVIRKLTHPKMNDVHHVHAIRDDKVIVVSTGLDSLLELTWDGDLTNSWSLSQKGADMLSDDLDYRLVESTKPHEVHPNFVFHSEDEMYVTRFKQKDAVCVTNPKMPTFHISRGNVHDGVVQGNNVWFTTTNGWVVAHNRETGDQNIWVDLNDLFQADRPLGWCRAVLPVDEDRIIVAFSRLRKTKFQENVRWAASKLLNKQAAPLPTRIAIVNIRDQIVECQVDLERLGLLNAVFLIHALR